MESLQENMSGLTQYSTAEELRASFPKNVTMMVKGCFKALKDEQLNDEVFLGAFIGNVVGINVVGTKKDASSTGIMAISNKRLIFIGKLAWMTKVEAIAWKNFDSYSAQKGMMFGEITVMSRSGHRLKVTSIDKKVWTEGKQILDALVN